MIKNCKIIKKIYKILIYFFSFIVLLPIIFYIVFRTSKVQTFIAQKAASYLSKQLNTEISVQGVDITYYLNIVLEGITIKDQQKKILLYSKEIKIKISDLKYKSKILNINNISFNNASFALRKYKDKKENNIKFLTDYFLNDRIKNTDNTKNKWLIKCSNLKISDSYFLFQDQTSHEKPNGIDFKNIKISKLNLSVKNIYYNNDTVYAKIDSLSFKENTGLCLNNLSADIFFSPNTLDINNFNLKTAETDFSADYNCKFKNINAFDDIFNNVKINCKISPSKINLKDVSYFVPAIFGMNDNIKISGEFSGFLSDIKIKNLICLYNDSTRFWGDIALKGLPDIENTFINSNIKELSLNIGDLKNLKFPVNFVNKINIPDKLNNINNIKLSGIFKGYYYDFVTTNSLQTNLGNINTDICFKKNPEINDYEYNGKINIRNFNLSKLLFKKNNYFGKINLNANIKGSGITLDDVKLNFNGLIDSLLFKDNVYNKIKIVGDVFDKKFNGLLSINDENVYFDFKGLVDFNPEMPAINFTSNIKNANLYNLNIFKRDTVSIFNSKLTINLKGNNIDNLNGNINFLNTSFQETNTLYKLNKLEISQNIDSLNNKTLKLNSDLVDANVNGNFSLSNIANSMKYFISKYLPSINDIDTTIKYKNQNFIFNINLKNTLALSKLLYPDIIIANNSYINGSFNSIDNNYYFNANSDLINFKGIKFNNIKLSQSSDNNKSIVKTSIEKIIFKERDIKDTLELGLDNMALNTKIFSDTINYSLTWDDIEKTDRNKGMVKGFVSFKDMPEIKIKFTDSDIKINDSIWSISKNNLIKIDTSSVNINNFAFIGNNQQLLMNGTISENPVDNFNFKLKNFDISYSDIILNNKNVDVDGIINGSLNITGFYNSPNYISNFKIKEFCLNHQKLGDLLIKTKWDDKENRLIVNSDIIYHGNFANTKPLSIRGYYAPDNDTTNFNFNMKLLNFKINTISPLFKSFSSKVNGLATGNLRLYNNKKNSYLVGKLKLKRSEMKIDYLNVTYSFADYINFKKNSIDFNNITIYDTVGNTAVLNGKYYHNFFKNSHLDLNIKPNKIVCLNLEPYQNSIFFGKAVASGNVSIKGPLKNIVIDVKVKTERGTDISIPINFKKKIANNNFIKFINKDDTLTDNNNIYYVNLSGYNLLFDFDVTNDARMQLFLPMQMGNIKANGYGNIKMDYNKEGNFNIFGDYYINKGSFFFNLQNMINKHFTIKKGGHISWTGDPSDAAINLKAVYKVRASLNGLESLTQLDQSYYNKKVNVNCILGLSGKISDPVLSFNIELPNADDETKQLIYSAIDTSNRVIMNEQMISLLVLNSFSFNRDNPSVAGSIGVSSFELLSNQLSNLLSKISDDFDIGVNYAPGDEISNEELEVALSTQLFNDRVLIDGNFGVRGDKNTQKTSNIIGDVNVEVKVTKDGRLRVKAFNKSNNVELLNDYTPYTQGVGIFYRKEFDSFKEFFTLKKKKKQSISNKQQSINIKKN